MTELAKRAGATFDAEKRKAFYLEAYNRNNEQAFVIPIASSPTVLDHTNEVNIPRKISLNNFGFTLSTLEWK